MLRATVDPALAKAVLTMGETKRIFIDPRQDVWDPWSVLPTASQMIAHGDDEWVALARAARVPVHVLSVGRFGTPHDNDAALDRKAVQAFAEMAWRNPYTNDPATIEDVISYLADWRDWLEGSATISVACGMAWWKRDEIRRLLWHPRRPLKFVRRAKTALAQAIKAQGGVAIWPSRVSPKLLSDAKQQKVSLIRVEDGFIRSTGLGVNLVPPSSIIVDRTGIHYDPSQPNDLETILNYDAVPGRLIERARSLRKAIVRAGISKYSADIPGLSPLARSERRLVLVAGQVEDDMSVLTGGGGLQSNLELLRRVRALEPDSELWYRPHPDVDSGHRKGSVSDSDLLVYADRIVRGGSMAALLDTVDCVHVLTSLTGFEALLRKREVACHGTPFFAGWGLTTDFAAIPLRRSRKLTLDALVAGALIRYPRYLDPLTGLPCPPEVLVSRMAGSSAGNRLDWIEPLRRWQGKMTTILR
ncbi:beta-3-deoxy-D-manno-oct-2-ulosonic acid transferase [Novosphingobium sp.]|uniref:capsular polysaccharide export protein, LipB/KpsS family n=1 Tax=Novosphingobium sp. TaxID=1874826 RepID=UPI0025EB50B5|nr:beta-3-deoxy-D-manno-oct-2-ulosonic acid transferase [Novosphingobium sp.]